MRYLFQLFILVLTIIGCKKSDNGILVPPSDPGMPLVNQMNVQYGVAPDTSGNNVNLLLDIYFPPAATTAKKYPLFVMIHGGGYVGGDKNGNADEGCTRLPAMRRSDASPEAVTRSKPPSFISATISSEVAAVLTETLHPVSVSNLLTQS